MISHEKVKETLKLGKDQLNISASLNLHGKDKQRSSTHSIEKREDGGAATREVGENLWLSCKENLFCDFTLISKDRKSFHCHKLVLASRSPVLKAMLNSGMAEANKQQLEIKNHESELLAIILEFIYKGIT